MQSRCAVGFDLDSVVADVNDMLSEMIAAETGLPVDWRDWCEYDYFERYGLSLARYLELCVENRILEEAPVARGAAECVRAFRSEGYEVIVVTARGFHPRGEQVTRDWLEQNGLHCDELVVVHPGQSKREALVRRPHVKAYIDDHVRHLDDIAKAGHGADLYLMDQPWNRACAAFLRVSSLGEFALRALSGRSLAGRKHPAEHIAHTWTAP